jgi:hypothetical protein
VSKPLGIGFAVRDGALGFTSSMPSRAEDKIWEAVQEARCAGWTVAQFRSECAEAWDHDMRDEQKTAAKEWSKP